MRERKKELIIQIGDCLDYCNDTNCEKKRSYLGNKIDEGCYECSNFINMQKLREELESIVSPVKENKKPGGGQYVGMNKAKVKEMMAKRMEHVHKRAKEGTYSSGEVAKQLNMSTASFMMMVRKYTDSNFTELVKKYKGGTG